LLRINNRATCQALCLAYISSNKWDLTPRDNTGTFSFLPFQDDDYIYPSLDLSDDEMEIGQSVTQAKDDAWSPKVRVKHVAGKSEPRPMRDKVTIL
jgi:hypothetical protein